MADLTQEQLDAIKAAVGAAMKERDASREVLAPRTGQAAVLKLDKSFEDHEQHPRVAGVIKVGELWVRHEDGEIFNDHGQRIGRRVDVLPVGG